MKTLPEVMGDHCYKYNIINRLALLKGGLKTLPEKKKELVKYLKDKGVNPGTSRSWLTIERGLKREIPLSAMIEIRNFFNQKYQQRHVPGSLNESDRFEKIELEDLYCEGQLQIFPER